MPLFMQLIAIFLLSVGFSVGLVRIVILIDRRYNLLDIPNERSSTAIAVPTLGGLAIFTSFLVVSVPAMAGYLMPGLVYIIFAATIMLLVGLIDDLITISPAIKLLGQCLATTVVIFLAGIRITSLHGIFGLFEIGEVESILVTFLTILTITNAFNLIDGIDGLAAGVGILAAVIFGSWFYLSGYCGYAVLSFCLTGSIAGFFFYNVYGKHYKIFMGDTGSLFIGMMIAVLAICFNELNIDQSQAYAVKFTPVISVVILGYPLIDTLRVIIIRILKHQSPFLPDKNHIHHRLLKMGLSHVEVTYTVVEINFLLIIIVFLIQNLGFFA